MVSSSDGLDHKSPGFVSVQISTVRPRVLVSPRAGWPSVPIVEFLEGRWRFFRPDPQSYPLVRVLAGMKSKVGESGSGPS